jgi:hypothetical protein
MIKMLIAAVGVVIALGGVAAAWFATESSANIVSIEAERYKQLSDNAYRHAGAEGEKKIAELDQQIKNKEMERNIRYGVACAGLLVGLSMALLPFVTWKRKTSAAALAPEKDAPGI